MEGRRVATPRPTRVSSSSGDMGSSSSSSEESARLSWSVSWSAWVSITLDYGEFFNDEIIFRLSPLCTHNNKNTNERRV